MRNLRLVRRVEARSGFFVADTAGRRERASDLASHGFTHAETRIVAFVGCKCASQSRHDAGSVDLVSRSPLSVVILSEDVAHAAEIAVVIGFAFNRRPIVAPTLEFRRAAEMVAGFHDTRRAAKPSSVIGRMAGETLAKHMDIPVGAVERSAKALTEVPSFQLRWMT